jgi:hypothetical protein
MSIRFQCECGKKLKASDDKIGKRVLCPDCGQPVTVPSRSGVAVEAIDATGAGGEPLKDSAQTARELLKLTAAASREEQEPNKAGQEQVRQKGDEAHVTLSQWMRYNATTVGLPALGVLVACLILYAISSQMFGETLEYPDLYPVSGTVMLDGKPLAGAMITFRPYPELDKERYSTSDGNTDAQGRYTLWYKQDIIKGAVLGKHFVEISKIGPDGRETLPVKYIDGSELKMEVTKEKKTGYDFVLNSMK